MSDKDKFKKMFLYVCGQIEKSRSPDANVKWFLSEEGQKYYAHYLQTKNQPKKDHPPRKLSRSRGHSSLPDTHSDASILINNPVSTDCDTSGGGGVCT